MIIGKISESEDLDINPEEITGEFKNVLDGHFEDDEEARLEYMKSGDSVALLNRISSQIITRKTLDFLMAIAQGEDITVFLKPEETQEESSEEAAIETSEVSDDEISSKNKEEKPQEVEEQE